MNNDFKKLVDHVVDKYMNTSWKQLAPESEIAAALLTIGYLFHEYLVHEHRSSFGGGFVHEEEAEEQ